MQQHRFAKIIVWVVLYILFLELFIVRAPG